MNVSMKKTLGVAVAAWLLAAPAFADKKLDDAIARADQQLQRGHPEEGVKTLQRVAEQTPSPEAYAALSRFQWKTGDADGAAKSSTKAVELSASAAPAVRSEVLATVSGLTLKRGSGKDALSQAQDAVKAQETPSSLAALARAQVRTQQNVAALQSAEKAVQAGATSAVAQEAHGEALLAAGRSAEAEAAFRKASQLDPKMAEAQVGLSQALLAQNKAAEAVAEARKASETDPKSGEAFAALGTAILAENSKNWPDAIAQAQQGAFVSPNSPVVQVAVGKIFEAGGNLDQAVSSYKRALEADPGYVPARAALVQVQIRKGELDAALPEAQKLAAEAPDSGEAQLIVGRLLAQKGDFAGAVGPLAKAAKALPGSAEAQALAGLASVQTRQPEQAVPFYKKAVELDPKNVDYGSNYGLVLAMTGKHDEAAAALKKVIATPGYKDVAGYANLGYVYRTMKPARTDEAIAAYKKAMEIDPKNEQVTLGLARSLFNANRFDEAIDMYKKTIELEPKYAGEADLGIAWSHTFKKDLAQARTTLAKAKGELPQGDTRVAQVAENIEKVEKGQQAEKAAAEAAQREPDVPQGPNVNSLGRTLQTGGAGARCAAARDLARFGAAAVDHLVYALANDKDWCVREAAIQSLGQIGPAASAAVPQLKAIIRANPYECTVCERKQMEDQAHFEDLRRAARIALQRIT
jgi:tetratricopeptide (TPR) repeat protein